MKLIAASVIASLAVLSIMAAVAGAQAAGRNAKAAPDPNEFVASAYAWNLPAWVPPPMEPRSNPTTQAKVDLGRRLFYDGRLAADGTRACGVCHQQSRAFSDPLPFSWGVTGEHTARQTMPLANIAYARSLTWTKPQVRLLEDQALGPMFGKEPVEMGMSGQEADLVARLAAEPVYRDLFPKAFPETRGAITLESITRALAAFERTLISVRSPYDRYRHGGDAAAISEAAKRGETLFFSSKLKCAECHSGDDLSDAYRPDPAPTAMTAFHNTGLYNLDGKGAYPASNIGAAAITGRAEDMGRFRTPSLRNVAVTAPYMHDGSIATLEGVIDHYAAGGRTLASGEANAGAGHDSPLKSPLIPGFAITPAERSDLVAFLKSLTDETFLTDPRFSDPWKQRQSGL